jgi:hypothetical protein
MPKICHIHTNKNDVLYSTYFLFHTIWRILSFLESHVLTYVWQYVQFKCIHGKYGTNNFPVYKNYKNYLQNYLQKLQVYSHMYISVWVVAVHVYEVSPCLRTVASKGPYVPSVCDIWVCSPRRIIFTGHSYTTKRKPCSISTLSTTNHTLTGFGRNPGLCGERFTSSAMEQPDRKVVTNILFFCSLKFCWTLT